MTESFSKDDETLVRVQAQVMTRDESSGGWVPMGGGGLSYVGLVRRVIPSEDCSSKSEYLIVGHRIADNSVVLKCDIKKDIRYTMPNPKFHHWYMDDKRFGLTFERYDDAKAFDKGIKRAVKDLTDACRNYLMMMPDWICQQLHLSEGNNTSNGYYDNKLEEDVFGILDLPIFPPGSTSQSTTSTTTSSPQSPTTYIQPTTDSLRNDTNFHTQLHVHYFPSPQGRHKSSSLHSDRNSFESFRNDEQFRADEPSSISGKSDQGLLGSNNSDNVELKEYSYVIFARKQPHEYSYPNLEPVQKPPLKREAISSRKYPPNTSTVELKPPLPVKTKKKDKHKSLQTGRQTKARCKHCHEMFSHECNHRGSCEEAPDHVEKCIEIVSCVGCAKGLIYHCFSDADGEYVHPCICDSTDESNCKKWTVLSVLSLLVPCLWCYWPLKACHMCGVSCGCCGGRHKES